MMAVAALALSTMMPAKVERLRPQPGPQEMALSSPADIVILGGANGGGKTWSLLYEPLRHVKNPAFGAVIFRRESPQITNQGGLWDESQGMYSGYRERGARPMPNQVNLSWTFPSGARVRFSHLQHAKDRFAWDGSQIPLIGFDQLESFEEIQFWFMLSRNRTTCGIRPYVRATVNPVPEDDPVGGWLNKLVAWWWDPETGYAIPERAGVVRWFLRRNEEIHWGDRRADLLARFPDAEADDVKSLTFVPAKLSDNPKLTEKDPGYRGNLLALPLVERERRLAGNWLIKATKGKVFNRAWFKDTLSAVPADVTSWVRYWDKAGTQGGGKFTAGVLMGKRANGRTVLANVVRGRWSALNRETMIKQTAAADHERFGNVTIWCEQEPGSGGKESAENTVRNLSGYMVHAERVTGDKVTRAGPLASQAEAGNVDLVSPLGEPAEGTEVSALEAFLVEAQNFDGTGVCDQIDGASGAFNKLALSNDVEGAAKAPPPASPARYGQTKANYGPARRLLGR